MIQSLKIAAIILSLLLTGCAATVTKSSSNASKMQIPEVSTKKIVMTVKANQTVSASSDWATMRTALNTGMSDAASKAGLEFSFIENDVAPTSEAATLVVINVNSYRHINVGTRMMLGVFTGNAYLDADVEFSDLQSRHIAGTRKYNTSSSAWEGIFSAMTNKQVQAISKEIVAEIIKSSSSVSAGRAVASNNPTTTYAVAAPAVQQVMTSTNSEMLNSGEANANAQPQVIAFRIGVSSTTVEKLAKQNDCISGKGASLITTKGPVEVYQMACDSGKTFTAKCELRQCSAM